MTMLQFEQVKEFIVDHYEHFGCYPMEVELDDDTVFELKDYEKFIDSL